ncbi:putative quinol monooxygenase [Nocardia gipuzkoensis]|uniref:putative quinol monooxygenase n=1 Tax=Nocardia gipuzkoensis TaxID=2749991 RepID=UPI0024565C88|nr:antibiotic biosynthesis monooxygenase [Nocardia gipuzkoensis]
MLIVAGYLRGTDRDRSLEHCREVVALARATEDCLDCALGAGLLEPDRVDVYERWTTPGAGGNFARPGPTGAGRPHI